MVDISHTDTMNLESEMDKVKIDSDNDNQSVNEDFKNFKNPYLKIPIETKGFGEILKMIHTDLKEFETGNLKLRKTCIWPRTNCTPAEQHC